MERRVKLLKELFEQDFEELYEDIPSDEEFQTMIDNDELDVEDIQQDAYAIGCMDTLVYVINQMEKFLR